MPETVYRFMDARMLMNLIAGNWASFDGDREPDEPVNGDGLLVVDIPLVRFSTKPNAACATGSCRGGVVHLDIEPLIEGDDYQRDGEDVYVMADALVAQPVSIKLRP